MIREVTAEFQTGLTEAEETLHQVLKDNLKEVAIIGVSQEDNLYYHSNMTRKDFLYLVEATKFNLMRTASELPDD